MFEPTGLRWHKSVTCNPSECIEVAVCGDHVLIRDSSDRMGPVLDIQLESWRAFIAYMVLKFGDRRVQAVSAYYELPAEEAARGRQGNLSRRARRTTTRYLLRSVRLVRDDCWRPREPGSGWDGPGSRLVCRRAFGIGCRRLGLRFRSCERSVAVMPGSVASPGRLASIFLIQMTK